MFDECFVRSAITCHASGLAMSSFVRVCSWAITYFTISARKQPTRCMAKYILLATYSPPTQYLLTTYSQPTHNLLTTYSQPTCHLCTKPRSFSARALAFCPERILIHNIDLRIVENNLKCERG